MNDQHLAGRMIATGLWKSRFPRRTVLDSTRNRVRSCNLTFRIAARAVESVACMADCALIRQRLTAPRSFDTLHTVVRWPR